MFFLIYLALCNSFFPPTTHPHLADLGILLSPQDKIVFYCASFLGGSSCVSFCTCFSTRPGRLRSVGDSGQNVPGSRPAADCGRTGPPCPSTLVSLIYQNSKSAVSRLSHPGLQTTRLSSLVPCGYYAMGLVTFTVSMATKPLPSVC